MSGLPFNPDTSIVFSLTAKDAQDAKIEIFNLKGQLIRNFQIDNVETGRNTFLWNGKDNEGNDVSSGVYFTELRVDGRSVSTIKMMLLK